MADYGLMPWEADERFSLRQMGEILKARKQRIENESQLNANILLTQMFGEQKRETDHDTDQAEPKSLAVFGIKVTDGGGDPNGE